MKEQGNSDDNITRRKLLQAIIIIANGLIAMLLAVPGLAFLLTPVFRVAGSSWVKVGSARSFVGSDPRKSTFRYMAQSGYTQKEKNAFVWIVPDAAGKTEFVALSAVCSHTGCNVAWQARERCFICPCHAGRYDREGNVVSGPPPRPLDRLPLKEENGNLIVQMPV